MAATVSEIAELETQICIAREAGFNELAEIGRLFLHHWRLARAMAIQGPTTGLDLDMAVNDCETFLLGWDGRSAPETF